MKILLSAYACAPNFGSEPAIGWNYATQLAEQGNEVFVLVNDWSHSQIEKYPDPLPKNITFLNYDLPPFIKNNFFTGLGILAHIYYFFWQIGAYFYVKDFLKSVKDIDIIHLITIGVFRTPVFLGLLNVPFVLGPVGGGETSTMQLQQNLPLKFKVKEKMRHWANLSTMLNPLIWITYRASNLILLKTIDNLKYIPKTFHEKCKVNLEVSLSDETLNQPISLTKQEGNFKILFVGRLEYWKGLHLAIRAFAHILEKNPNVTFTVVGEGPDENWFKEIAKQLGVLDKIEWLQRVPQKNLFAMYKEFDILLFPSFHDSSGNVVIEALAYGLPVVCLDLGGPKELIDATCGIIISTRNNTEAGVVENIIEEINILIEQPKLLLNMRENALHRAKQFSISQVVNRTYSLIQHQIFEKYQIP